MQWCFAAFFFFFYEDRLDKASDTECQTGMDSFGRYV